MRISHLTALAGLAAATALGGCVAAAPGTTTAYSYNYPSYSGYPYYSSYTVSHTYPYGYTAPFSTDYNGSFNTYANDGGNGQ